MSSNQSLDLRAELTCGDPSRQSRALLAVLGLLSAGRDVTIHVSVVCQAVLGNPNVTSSIKCTAYDLAAAASLSDADQGRMSAAIVADLQKGSPAELRTKALAALAQLPSHRLVSLLGDATARGRIGSMLRSPSAAVRAAAIDALGAMWTIDAVPAAAHEDEGIGRLLDDGVAVAAEGLCHDDPLVVQAACRALAALFQSDAALSQKSADGSAPPQAAVGSEAANASAVRAPLADSALMQVGSVFGTAQSRFRKLPVGRLLEVPPLLISYLRALRARSGVRPLDTLPGDAALVHAHAFEESVGLLGDVVGIGDPAAVLAATQGLLELAEVSWDGNNVRQCGHGVFGISHGLLFNDTPPQLTSTRT